MSLSAGVHRESTTANRPGASVIKLYGYVVNDPVNFIDPSGLQIPPPGMPGSAAESFRAAFGGPAYGKLMPTPPRLDTLPESVGDVRSYYYLNGIPDPFTQEELRKAIPDYTPPSFPDLTRSPFDVAPSSPFDDWVPQFTVPTFEFVPRFSGPEC